MHMFDMTAEMIRPEVGKKEKQKRKTMTSLNIIAISIRVSN